MCESPVVWRRAGTQLPPFLKTTKSGLAGTRHSGFVLPQPPILVSGSGPAEIAVATFEGGALYLDLAGHKVTRVYPRGTVINSDQIDLRKRFEAHTNAPKAEYAADGTSHIEDYIHGNHLHDLSPEAQLTAIRSLLADHERLVGAEGADDASDTMRNSLAVSLQHELPTELRPRVQDAMELLPIIRVPWIPSAKEANLKNLIVRKDLSVSPIDLGDLELLPSIWYPLGIISDAGDPTISAFLKGDLDAQFLALVGGDSHDAIHARSHWREELIIARMVYAAAFDAADAANPPGGEHAFMVGIRRRWSSIRPWLGEGSK